ncbi:MAG: polymerase [Verrucomicrobiota bacterium]|jgi:protein ImuB
MFATIYLPNFYLQAALRHQPELRDQAAALIEEQEKKPLIIQLNRAAESTGVRKGMTPSQALARYLQVVIKARSRPNERAIGDLLLQHAFSLSPNVEATAPGVATVQFTDTRHITDKVADVVVRLAECEIDAQVGVAWTPDSSFLAAHLAQPVLYVDDVRKFLAPLPIETLAI